MKGITKLLIILKVNLHLACIKVIKDQNKRIESSLCNIEFYFDGLLSHLESTTRIKNAIKQEQQKELIEAQNYVKNYKKSDKSIKVQESAQENKQQLTKGQSMEHDAPKKLDSYQTDEEFTDFRAQVL